MKISKLIPLSLIIQVSAQETPTGALDPLTVTGKAESLIGIAGTASKGQANSEELLERPYLRRGELLEVVPGVIITQHSGDGKANQYFVRGFNLDHGTDFSIWMDGQPVNFVTHAHGQGYADLNPLIPEMVESIDYWKGPFHAHLGDLSTAGATRFNFFDTLPSGIASVGVGQHNYFHGLLADTIYLGEKNANGDFSALTYGLEYNYYDGPWQREGNSQRANGFLKYFQQSGRDSFSVTAMAYDADEGFYGTLRSRFFSSRPLVEDGGVDSRPSWQLNGRLGYRKNDWEIALDVLNILGREDNDIEYFYTSRLPGEPLAGVDDVHLHPTEPRTFRVSLTKRF